MKLSFDFDGTLSRKDVQDFAKSLVNIGHDVYIVTSRISTEPALKKGWHWIEKQNQELYDVAQKVGIKKENIIFTEFVDKINFLSRKGFTFHLDDDEEELIQIFESEDSCQGINVEHSSWKQKCESLLK